MRRLGLTLPVLALFLSGCAGLVTSGNSSSPSTLIITNVQAGAITTSSSQVVWTTNDPADSSVDYGTTTAYGNNTPVSSAMVTGHQMTLSGLAAGTTYYYQVNSTNSKGNHGHGGGKFTTAGYGIAGTISPSAGGNGATITLTGAASATATADSSGNFTFAALPNGTYGVAPAHTGYTFTPSSQSTTVNGANVAGVNFTANAASTAPTITTHPANQAVTAGQAATFAVTATGTAPLSYQWNRNGAPMSGATSSSYTTAATTSSDNGAQFTVVVSNTAGSVTSNAATLTVNAAPVAPSITTQPTGQTVTAGQSASFTVAATGTAPLSYQWKKNTVAISGATSTSYTTPATTSSDNGAQFTVVVSNTAGSVTSNAATLTVNAAPVAPSITTQPASQTVTTGQPATFAVVAAGTAPLSYQWNRNGAPMSGATSSSYTTAATTSSDNGAQFTIVVTNSAGSVTSNAATLTVNAAPVPPSITAQPANQTVTAGQTASFSVTATGTAPLSYQWSKNSVAISGATSASYTTPATSSSDNGAQFTAVVSNTAGNVTSSAATLTVNPAPASPSITAQPANQTVTAGQTASFSVTATGTAPLSYQWKKNSVAISGATSASYTTPATSSSDNGAQFTVVVSNTAGNVTSSAATLTVNPAPASPSITAQPANQTVTAGQTASFSVTATGTAPLSYQWKKNSAAVSGATSASYTTPATTSSDNGAQFTVVVTNTAGSVTSNAATLTVNPAPVAPSITTQPVSQTVTAGQTASFTVAATGTAPLSYQWNRNGAAISGATSSSYTTAATTSSDNGAQFTVLVSNSAGSVTSNAATLTVNPAPVVPSITSQPVSQTVTAGQAASFTVAATGTAPLSYQWRKNSVAISGGTSASYTTPATTSSDNGAQFTVVVTNTAGSVTSSAAMLTVNAAPVGPSITTQPVSQTVTAGQSASFTVAATGTAPLSYQWKKNSVAISGATSASYTTPATTSSDNGAQFTVVVTNTAGSVTSNAAMLTVNAAPVAPSITGQPASQTVTAGQSASFTVAATGTAPLSYQWSRNGAPMSGATSSSYTTAATTSSDNGAQFTVVVTNTAGSVTSSAAMLTVNAAPVGPSITTQPVSQTVTAGQSASFTVAATGTAPLSYQWRKNGTAITGATSSSYTTPAATSSDNGTQFTVVVTNSAGSVTSAAATLTVNSPLPPTVAISSPANGATVSGTITVSGTASDSLGVSSVQVQVDSGAFSTASGTASWSFSLDTTSLSNAAHTLSARATDTLGATATSSVTVNVSNTSGGPIVNVKNFGATGNGSTDDTGAINSAIGALTSGATLFFPCGTYNTSSQLTINTSNITVDGGSCATVRNMAGSTILMMIGGSGNGNPNYGSAVSLAATANELATSFTTVSGLGVAPGDYVLLNQGGKDSSNGSGDTGCDPSGCRGELLKVASVSGNTITVTTALHDTFNPSLNGSTAQKILGPLSGITVKNITFDGNGSNVYGLAIAGVADSTISGVTAKNVQGAALLNRGDFNVAWSNITVTGAGSAQCASAIWFEKQGNLSINGMTVSNENPGASGTGCLYNGAFGAEFQATANSTIVNLTVDATGAYGRPFKTSAARYDTFNSLTVKNGVQDYNGVSLEYYSSHNTFNNCVVTNNGAGTGTGTGNAGINTFGNFNQYNSFNNCTVSGNGNIQVLFNSYDALRLGQDSNNTINGGTFTGSNSVQPAIEVEGASVYVHNATISGPGFAGVGFNSYGTNGCINSNTFTAGTSLSAAINSSSTTNVGSGNIMNGLSSNLTLGTCGPSGVSVTVSPTSATVASGGTQQFTATVTGSTNTAVNWSATSGTVSSSGLFTAPTVSANTTVTITAASQADTSRTASATVTVTPAAPPNTFGYAVQGATVGTTMSNSVSATRYQMAAKNATVTSMSVFIASPISASPNNQFQVAIYADNNGTPGALIASSVPQTILPDTWNTVSITAPVAANTYYWLAYNTNGLAANTNNLRLDTGGATSSWISAEPFGTWPATYGPVGGSGSYSTSMYCTFQ